MKHKHILILFLLSFFFLVGITVKADTGPKPSTYITFNNLDRDIYVTLLSRDEGRGPWSLGAEQDYNEIEQKFAEYAHNTNYYFLGYTKRITKDDNTFSWTYYPPDNFVILCYSENDATFFGNDELISRYAFDSYFKLDYNNLAISNIEKNYNYGSEILHFFLRCIITITIELLLAYFVFRFKKKSFIIILITNLVTQIFLNVFLNISNYYHGSLSLIINYIVLELLIVLIEAVTYVLLIKRVDKEYKISGIILYAILANILSFGLGLIILRYVPGLG